MIAEYKEKREMYSWAAFCFGALALYLHYVTGTSYWAILPLISMLVSGACLWLAVYYNLIGKGQPGRYVVWMALGPIGWIAYCFLKDNHKDQEAQEEKVAL